MKRMNKDVSRRQFLQFAGAAGIGSIIGKSVFAEPNDPTVKLEQANQPIELPKRKLGKTGVEVPCLTLGVSFNAMYNQLILRKAIDWGVVFWDTSHNYSNGNSEFGIGKFFQRNPDARKKIFLVSKASHAKNIQEVEQRLQTSFKRMNTDYIDLYYGVHGLSDPSRLNEELKRWALSAKEKKQIKFFGFSTHNNMADCLVAASKLGWIDAVMTSYNFRLMQDAKLVGAIKACHDAGKGVIVMKTQGQRVEPAEGDDKLTEHFRRRGFTEGQAKVKLVLENKHIVSVCFGRGDIEHVRQNVAAVLDKTELTQADKDVFKTYATQTCSGYCAGCAHICNEAVPQAPFVNDIMRSLMYHNSYGDKLLARQTFAEIPAGVRANLLKVDYNAAEARCPQRMPIGRLIAEAVEKLA